MTSPHLILLASATPSPSPTIPEPLSVTPGLPGFLVIFAIALVLVVLMLDMTKRMRRIRYRAEVAARDDADRAEGRHET